MNIEERLKRLERTNRLLKMVLISGTLVFTSGATDNSQMNLQEYVAAKRFVLTDSDSDPKRIRAMWFIKDNEPMFSQNDSNNTPRILITCNANSSGHITLFDNSDKPKVNISDDGTIGIANKSGKTIWTAP